jgi:hypothetical protein
MGLTSAKYPFALGLSVFLVLYPLIAGSPAMASGEIGPPFNMGGNAVFGPAPEYQISTSVAFDGTNHMVVWADYRSGTSYDIYGARVAPDGTVLDQAGIVISAAAGDQEAPAVAFGGTSYLVVWRDTRNGSYDIYGARLSPGGEVLDAEAIPITIAGNSQTDASVAFGDSTYLVVWTDSRNGTEDVYGTRVTGAGAVLDSAGIAISTASGAQHYPSVAYQGTLWLVAWQDSRNGQPDIYGARVAGDGTSPDTSGVAISTGPADEMHPRVASDGARFFVVWDDLRNASDSDIYAARVDTSGSVLDSSGIAVCVDGADQAYVQAGFDGTDYFIVWDDLRGGSTWDVYGVHVDTGGTLIESDAIAICLDPSQQFGLAMAFDGADWLLAWHDSRNGPKDIYGLRVAQDGTVIDAEAILITSSASPQSYPALASDGSAFLAVWHELRDGSYDIRGTRVALDGTVLDPAGLAISTASGDQMYPAVAFDGTNYVAVWQDRRGSTLDIYAARIAPDGTVLDPTGIPVCAVANQQEHPSLAFGSTTYMVVWQDNRGGTYDIFAGRLTPAGTVINPAGIPICNASRDQERPAISFDGTNYMVVWQDERNVYNDIYGARVNTIGAVLDSGGVGISNAILAQEYPDIVFDGAKHVVVWQDKRGSSNYDIYMARVGTDGTVMDPSGIRVSDASGDQLRPAVTFNSRDLLIVWQDGRSGPAYDIYSARVDTSGIVLDPSGVVVSSADLEQMLPDACTTPFGQVLISYSCLTPPPEYGSYRIWANYYDTVAGLTGEPLRQSGVSLSSFPNPFVGATTLRLGMAVEGPLSVNIYDVEGRLVAAVFDGEAGAGPLEFTWDCRTTRGHRAAPGVYFVAVQAGRLTGTHRITLLR